MTLASFWWNSSVTGGGTDAFGFAIRGVAMEFDLGGHKWVKETKQPHKKFKVDWFGGIVVINVYKRFLFLDKNAFINVFLFFQRFLFLKNVERSAW